MRAAGVTPSPTCHRLRHGRSVCGHLRMLHGSFYRAVLAGLSQSFGEVVSSFGCCVLACECSESRTKAATAADGVTAAPAN